MITKRMRAAFVSVGVVALVTSFPVASSMAGRSSSSTSAAVLTVNVTAREYSFTLSAKTAKVGKVVFAVKNAGKKNHDFKIAGKKTPLLKPGKSARLAVTFAKAGPFAYSSTVAGDAKKGMKGVLTIKAATVNLAAGKQVYVSTGCGACHQFKAAGSTGMVGPNLDTSRVSRATIVDRVTNGKGTMPAYKSQLTSKQIQDVADFVFLARG